MTADQEIALLKDAMFATVDILAAIDLNARPRREGDIVAAFDRLLEVNRKFRDDEAEHKGVSREA